MPSTYAHYKLGLNVKKQLSAKQKEIISQYPELYLIGLHGPDILFYYKPLFSNSINKIGFELHKHSGKEFFMRSREVIHKQSKKEPYLAYAYGVLNHFALDMTCHGYVDEAIQRSGVSHTEIEVEFDRMLMVEDRKNPLSENLTKHINPSLWNATIVSAFYPGTNERQVEKALKSMIFYNRLLRAPYEPKRSLIYGILKLTGNYKEMHGLIVNYKPNPLCRDSNRMLKEFQPIAELTANKMIINFDDYMRGKNNLNDLFDWSFESRKIEREHAS